MTSPEAASVTYEQPSYGYYGPDTTAGTLSDEEYAYIQEETETTGNEYTESDRNLALSSRPLESPATNTQSSRTHTVVKGDSLYALARTYYRDQSKWKVIYSANRGVLTSPDFLPIGQDLVIP